MSEQSCYANKLAYERGPPVAGTRLPHSPAKCLPGVYLLPNAHTYYLGVGTPALAQWGRGLSASPVKLHEKLDMVTQISARDRGRRIAQKPKSQLGQSTGQHRSQRGCLSKTKRENSQPQCCPLISARHHGVCPPPPLLSINQHSKEYTKFLEHPWYINVIFILMNGTFKRSK